MLDRRYQLVVETPQPEEYCRMRVLAGLSAKSLEGARIGLPNTFFAVTIRVGGKLVGMGRVVGDGGLTFQVVDIAVDPEHQGRGLGKEIVWTLVEHLNQTLPVGAHVSLLADGPAKHLYAKYGFQETAPEAVGMALPVRKA
jgi:ribosomal protein S18 acetylase RimI-like enzyme